MPPRSKDDSVNDPRRQFLVRSLASGLLVGGLGWRMNALAGVLGEIPKKLPPGRSIFELSGDVRINDQPTTAASMIRPGDRIRTGKGARLVGVIGADALMLRENTELEIAAASAARKFFRVVTGGLLAVFGPRRDRFDLRTPLATIGIRGTGVYVESDPERTYLCTCYGVTDIAASDDPAQTETIRARHHDAPRYVLAQARDGKRIIPAGFVDHTDLELMTLEALVGREVPFAVTDGDYLGPRRDY